MQENNKTIFSRRRDIEEGLEEIEEEVLPDHINCEVEEKRPGTLKQDDDRDPKKNASFNNIKVLDRNQVLLLITTGMLISFASVGIAMNAGYKADSPVVWGPLTLSIVCMLTLVGLCNSKASNSIKPQAVRELNPAERSKGFGPY